MLLPRSLISRRLRFLLLSALAGVITVWVLTDGQQQEQSPRFDAELVELKYPLVWTHIHSFDGFGGGKQLWLWLCGVRIWQHYITRIEFKAPLMRV